MSQIAFTFRSWGGARRNAGRKPLHGRALVQHAARPAIRSYEPVHVTLRVRRHVWNLRSERALAVIHRSLDGIRRRPDFRVVDFAVQGNHVHLIVEAEGKAALGNGMRSLSGKLTVGLNGLMGTKGPVFEGRYHAHPLRTLAEVRNARHYVLGNFATHARRRGEPVRDGFVDPYASALARDPRVGQLGLWPLAVTSDARTWLMGKAQGERRASAG